MPLREAVGGDAAPRRGEEHRGAEHEQHGAEPGVGAGELAGQPARATAWLITPKITIAVLKNSAGRPATTSPPTYRWGEVRRVRCGPLARAGHGSSTRSVSPGTGSKRRAAQSAVAASMQLRRLATKFHQM